METIKSVSRLEMIPKRLKLLHRGTGDATVHNWGISGVYRSKSNGKTTYVATDSRMLIEAEVDSGDDADDGKALISAKEWKKATKDKRVPIADGEGAYPEYEEVIPSVSDKQVIVNPHLLKELVGILSDAIKGTDRLAISFPDDPNTPLRFDCENDEVKVVGILSTIKRVH